MPARLWSELPPWERRAELVKAHPDLTESFLIADGRAVPELAPQIDAQKSQEDRLKVVLRYFGDEAHPQPEERGALMPLIWGLGEPEEEVAARMRRSPPWKRLHRLGDDEPESGSLDELDLGGEGYTDAEVAAALDLLTRGQLYPRALEREGPMSLGRARRLSAWFTSGAAGWDGKRGKLTAAPGFRWVKRKTRKGPRLALIRAD
jgi:hypothetical protein